MRFHTMPAENTSRIKRDEPQSRFAQDSQPEDEIVLRQGPLLPNHPTLWDNWSNRSKEVICMAKKWASSRRPLTHQGYTRLWVPTMLRKKVPYREDNFPQCGRRWMCLNRPNSATPQIKMMNPVNPHWVCFKVNIPELFTNKASVAGFEIK